MKIKKISFNAGSRVDTTICDCCGKSIKNIYYITLADDSHLRLGTTCFDKQMKTNLDKMAKRKVNGALNSIQHWETEREYWETVTEEQYKIDRTYDYNERVASHNYEGIDTFEDYRKWVLTELIPYRLSVANDEIRKYARI